MDESNTSWTLRIRQDSDKEALCFIRRHSLRIGPPLTFDSEEPSVSALETALAALGAETVNGLGALARRRRKEILALEIVLQAQVEDPLAALGVIGESGSPALERIHMRGYVSTLHEPEEILALWDDLHPTLPLLATFRRACSVDIDWKITL